MDFLQLISRIQTHNPHLLLVELAHFQREQEHGVGVVQRRVLRDAEGEAGLAHARTGADDNEVARLQTCEHFVEASRKKLKDLLVVTKLLTVFDTYDDEKSAISSFN